SQPYYSVGEYWDGNVENLKNWINGTYSSGANISGAFDFTLYYNLSGIIQNSPSNNYANLNWAGSMAGLSGQYGFAEKAVTFVDNHDTFSQPSAFLNNNIPVAYAYILTHPGIPSVFAPHYYGGTYSKDGTTRIYSSYANVINKLTSIRKATGIDAHSHITIDKAQVGVYGAYISKRYGEAPVLAMKIGPYDWSPSGSDWVLATSGNNYAVWTKTAVNTPPSINLTAPTGTYITGESKTISLSSTDDSGVAPVIRYTTDGTEPTASSPIYNGGITINSDTTIKAAAFDNEGLSSGVIERTFTFTTMTTKNIVIKFKPAGSNWALPYIHYWGVQPSGQIPDANWANPVAMTADTNNTGWYQYSFPNSASVNFLFRNGENNGVQGRTQTADITNITENKCYEWASSSPFVKEIDCSTLSVNDVTDNKMNFQVLENPAKGVLKLKYSNANNGVISIYDISGKLVKSFSLTASSNENEELNISQLKSGIY
ncbi:MAG: chitobiase/beta-hexosaminidase C-terminal domain-containing protein, partial [Bergeyella zoohelcum]|nr:chitobiase/beta-hexosaminidase C-terminal domain-containing protein [Bergeyella zoohelcum]